MKTLQPKPLLMFMILGLAFHHTAAQDWPKPANSYSWDGSWTPDFPITNLFDDYYNDAHLQGGQGTPVLPPGKWDWGQEHNLANWKLFKSSFGHFAAITDVQTHAFGWKLVPNIAASELTAGAAYFTGSPGMDILYLGNGSSIHSTGEINLGDGPDILRFEYGWSLNLRSGSSLSGAIADDDLIFAGRNLVPANGDTDISQASIVTGPGRDLVFVNNMAAAGVDAGCGAGGRTDSTDPNDGDDIVIFGGNMRDFRFLGGKGNDVAVWYVDQVQQQAAGWTWLGPNFFGGGAWGNALWEDKGTDRLVLAVPVNTPLNNAYGAPPAGQINVYLLNNYPPTAVADGPTQNNVFARYCITCGIGPQQRKTICLEYKSANGKVFTGRCFVTAFEELQIGIGAGAKVYKLNDVQGKAIIDNSLQAIVPPSRALTEQSTNTYINGLKLIDPPMASLAQGGGAGAETPETAKIADLETYPNPATDILRVRFSGGGSGNCTLSLSDLNGQLKYQSNLNVVEGINTYQVSIAGLPGGMYWLLLQNEQDSYHTKVLIQ